jgi:hypothetical protein
MAPPKKKRQHGLAYRWIVAVVPILAIFFVLLGAAWVYTTYLKPPTPAQQWTTIQDKWSPLREKAREDIATAAKATPFDLAAYQAACRSYSNQIKGWTDAVLAVKDWGDAQSDIPTLQTASEQFVSLLQSVDSAKTAYDVVALQSQIDQYDTAFTQNVINIRQSLGLATPAASPSPFEFPSVEPTATPGESGSPGASGSPAASASPAPTETPTPAPSAAPSAT